MKAYVLANTYILMFIALLSATKNLERTKISINYAVDIQQDSSVNINWSEKKKKTSIGIKHGCQELEGRTESGERLLMDTRFIGERE